MQTSEVRVRKSVTGNTCRYRYASVGRGSKAKGDFTIPELEKMESISFSFAASMSDKDKLAVKQKWNHKIKGGNHGNS